MILCEIIEPDIAFVGCIEKLTRRSVFLDKIDHHAKWIGSEEFMFKDITRVDFGDSYVEALALVDAHNKQAVNASNANTASAQAV